MTIVKNQPQLTVPKPKAFAQKLVTNCSQESVKLLVLKNEIEIEGGSTLPSVPAGMTMEIVKEAIILCRSSIVCYKCNVVGKNSFSSDSSGMIKIKCECKSSMDWKRFIPMIIANKQLLACAKESFMIRKGIAGLAPKPFALSTESPASFNFIDDNNDSRKRKNLGSGPDVVEFQSIDKRDEINARLHCDNKELRQQIKEILAMLKELQSNERIAPKITIVRKGERTIDLSNEKESSEISIKMPEASTRPSYAQVAKPTEAQMAAAKTMFAPSRPRPFSKPSQLKAPEDVSHVYFANFKGDRPFSETRKGLRSAGIKVGKVVNIDYLLGRKVHFIVDSAYTSDFVAQMKGCGFTHLPNYNPLVIKDTTIPELQKISIMKREASKLAGNIVYSNAQTKTYFTKIYNTCSDSIKTLVDASIQEHQSKRTERNFTIDEFMSAKPAVEVSDSMDVDEPSQTTEPPQTSDRDVFRSDSSTPLSEVAERQ